MSDNSNPDNAAARAVVAADPASPGTWIASAADGSATAQVFSMRFGPDTKLLVVQETRPDVDAEDLYGPNHSELCEAAEKDNVGEFMRLAPTATRNDLEWAGDYAHGIEIVTYLCETRAVSRCRWTCYLNNVKQPRENFAQVRAYLEALCGREKCIEWLCEDAKALQPEPSRGPPRPDGEAVHLQVYCDGCKQNPLIGQRYKCRQCYNFDLCSACNAMPAGTYHAAEHTSKCIDQDDDSDDSDTEPELLAERARNNAQDAAELAPISAELARLGAVLPPRIAGG